MRSMRAIAAGLGFAAALFGCRRPHGGSDEDPSATAFRGDAMRGRELMAQFECARCHTVEAMTDPPKDKQCTGCHHDIDTGAVTATQAQRARWQSKVAELGDLPSLVSVGARLRRAWIRTFLMHPHDLRPALVPTMPRLPLTDDQATDIATYLSPLDDAQADDSVAALAGADPARGRELIGVKGCGLCHRMSGVDPLVGALLPVGVTVSDMPRAIRLAPDLRYTRDRWRASSLVRWLLNPAQLKRDTPMPNMALSSVEAKSIAAYILSSRLAPRERAPEAPRLGMLDRKVTYDEVATRVFRKTCWHCHGEPDFERGDGGPGNSGGFGFKGRGLNLSDYASTFAGYLDDAGKRMSVFAPTQDGTPYIVAAMLARRREEAGQDATMRGMPLGLPALAPEEIQLVETWLAQGRPR
jgi:cytochrome c2